MNKNLLFIPGQWFWILLIHVEQVSSGGSGSYILHVLQGIMKHSFDIIRHLYQTFAQEPFLVHCSPVSSQGNGELVHLTQLGELLFQTHINYVTP